MAKHRIKEDCYGNWNGYEGQRKVECFFYDGIRTQEENANLWLKKVTAKNLEEVTETPDYEKLGNALAVHGEKQSALLTFVENLAAHEFSGCENGICREAQRLLGKEGTED